MSPSRARARIIPLGPNPSPLGGIARMPTKKSPDPFGEVRAQTLRHRAQHGCGAYPFEDGAILGVIAAAVAAKRVLELGCALGYTALWFGHGAKDASIDTLNSIGSTRASRVRISRRSASPIASACIRATSPTCCRHWLP